jgi:3-mercaptopyruvate sulfurtransferase SseA
MAAGAWFILSEVLGNPAVALYDGSMVEWADGKRPVANTR